MYSTTNAIACGREGNLDVLDENLSWDDLMSQDASEDYVFAMATGILETDDVSMGC
jgi:hypothetical protein